MQAILTFLSEIFSQPAFLMGIIAFVGLVALRSPGNKLLTGTLKPILGYLMLRPVQGLSLPTSIRSAELSKPDLIFVVLFLTTRLLFPSPRRYWVLKP